MAPVGRAMRAQAPEPGPEADEAPAPVASDHSDQVPAAITPSDTRESIVAAPCRAWSAARRWKGHAHHVATGAARASSTHCQPGNRRDGERAMETDRSPS